MIKFMQRRQSFKAVKWTGDNRGEVEAFLGGYEGGYYVAPLSEPMIQNLEPVFCLMPRKYGHLALLGQWIVKFPNGDFSPFTQAEFEKNLEEGFIK